MNNTKTYDHFPGWVVLISTLFSLSIYTIGAYIVSGLSIFALVIYLIYCVWMEVRVIKTSCVSCAYYGKTCAFGKGKLCSLLFKKGDPEKFVKKEVTWFDVLPDFLVFILPVIAGVRLLVRQFDWMVLILMILLLVLGFFGNAIIRGQYACRFCKQREIGCPAEKLFNKKSVIKDTEHRTKEKA